MKLLQKLYDFYSRRYTNTELEKKFNEATQDLINSGDINKKDYIEFCVTHDIEPVINKTISTSTPSTPYSYPCSSPPRRRYSGGC